MSTCIRMFAGATILLAMAQAALGQSIAPLPGIIGTNAQGDSRETVARQKGHALIPTCRFEGARCGYIDRNGNVAIAPQFDWVDFFVDGRAPVGSGGKFGAIDSTGRFTIAPVYDSISEFDRGLALALVENRIGVIDQNGQLVVPAEHGLIVRLTDDAFLVAEPPYIERDRRPDWRLDRLFTPAHGKRWGIVASGGNWVMRPTLAQIRVASDDLSGIFWAAESSNRSTQWRLAGRDGTPVNTDSFDDVQAIQSGQDRAIVRRGDRWGAINSKGQIVVDLKFDWLGYFRDGWAPYRLAGREGRIDKDGTIFSAVAAQPRMHDGKLGAVVDGKPLYTDQAGTTLLGTDHPKCEDGRRLRFENGGWTIVTADDRPIPDVSFAWVHLACHGPSVVKHDGKWGFIAADGRLLANRYFDHANAFHEGIATIVDGGLWAVLTEDGSVLLGPLKLARGTAVSGSGEYSIEFEEGYKKLDKALIAELARNPDELTRRLAPRLRWSEGLAAQFDEKTGKWGFIEPTKNFAIAPQFDAVSPFSRGAAWVAFPDRREWCVIDKTGQIKPGTRCQCDQPLVIVEHYRRPSNLSCYDDGIRIVRGFPAIRGTAN